MTAQRRAQSIMDVPIAITAIAGDTLAKQGINNSADLASAVPNLQVSSPYGSTQPNFSLRGVSVANEYNSNQASPIGVYIDDVRPAREQHRVPRVDVFGKLRIFGAGHTLPMSQIHQIDLCVRLTRANGSENR